MAKVKFTERKASSASVKSHLCRFPGCGRQFAFRQGMSRHMRNAHRVSAKDYKLGKQAAGAPMFSQEERVTDAFQGEMTGHNTAEDLLIGNALQQILEGVPTFDTLSPLGDVEPLSPLQPDETPAEYAMPDAPDVEGVDDGTRHALVTDGGNCHSSSATEKPSPLRIAKRGAVRRVSKMRPLPALPGARPRGKDIRRAFDLQLETSLWPAQSSTLRSCEGHGSVSVRIIGGDGISCC